jgi:hypothetical protein
MARRIFTYSEDPYRDTWNHLRFLAIKSNAKNLLAGKIPSAMSVIIYEDESTLEKKAAQVSFGINQSYEYFRAAETVSVVTSPLLYFYGMLSLAKSPIVANQTETYLEDIAEHGRALIRIHD